MLEFIGMAILALAIGMNIKEYRVFFRSKKRKQEKEEEFKKAIDDIRNSGTVSSGLATSLIKVTFIIAFAFQLLFYGFLAGLTGFYGMYILGLIIVLISFYHMRNISNIFKKEDVRIKYWGNTVVPLKTIFFVSFIVVFWIL